jgi:hypothetical protein
MNIRFVAEAKVVDGVGSPVADVDSLDGVVIDEEIADFLVDYQPGRNWPVSAGRVGLKCLPSGVQIQVDFEIDRSLTDEEFALLLRYVSGQLLDGVGEDIEVNGLFVYPIVETVRLDCDGADGAS